MNIRPALRRPRFRSRTVAALTALLLPLAAMVGLATPAEAATSATAAFTKASDWGTGFEGRWTVKNTGTTSISSWTVEWDFPAGTSVGSAWDADVTGSGNHWTGKNKSYNGTLAPGASVSFGFNGAGPGSPSNCKLNGGSCDGGVTVPGDSAPSAPGTPTAGSITNTSVRLSWSAATDDKGVKNYDVLRDGAKIATVTGTTYNDTGLTAGTDYSYTVQARDTADQTGPVSGARAVHTTGGGTRPGHSGGGDKVKLGYFTDWGIYARNYQVKNLVSSGSAAKVTHINYAFGNVTGGKCAIGDSLRRLRQGVHRRRERRRRRRHLGPAAARQLQPAAQAQGQVPRTSRSSGRSAAGPGRAASARRPRTRRPSPSPATTSWRTPAGPMSSTASTSTGSTRTPAA